MVELTKYFLFGCLQNHFYQQYFLSIYMSLFCSFGGWALVQWQDYSILTWRSHFWNVKVAFPHLGLRLYTSLPWTLQWWEHHAQGHPSKCLTLWYLNMHAYFLPTSLDLSILNYHRHLKDDDEKFMKMSIFWLGSKQIMPLYNENEDDSCFLDFINGYNGLQVTGFILNNHQEWKFQQTGLPLCWFNFICIPHTMMLLLQLRNYQG